MAVHVSDGRLIASPTDLANFLACRHKTSLDLLVAEGGLEKPAWVDPFAEILQRRGEEHERRYVDRLRAAGLAVVDLGPEPRDRRPAATREAMFAGADVIVQAALANDAWLGYADVLRKVARPSALGDWCYEVVDTKLSRETRGGTILQLCVYSALVGEVQGSQPSRFHVVTPAADEAYRVDDFGAFHRQTKGQFEAFVAARRGRDDVVTYPEPVRHCDVCRWSSRCTRQRRRDDHLTFVAGLGRSHVAELKDQHVTTMAGLAAVATPIAFRPRRGSRETYERLRAQARLQVERRESGRLVFDLLPLAEDAGFASLPEPRPGDLFLDLEGDPFGRPGVAAESGETSREYLFGIGRVEADGGFSYSAHWAFSDDEEHDAFDRVMDVLLAAIEADPMAHVYHYAPYEPSAFKRLAGRYAAREADLDRLLRGGRFVDLYAVVRQALRAAVERYSIKDLEPFYAFTRSVDLGIAGDERRVIEVALETGDLSLVTAARRTAVEGYNRDDVRSALALRQWLERLRQERIDAGDAIPRPSHESGEGSEKVNERDRRSAALRAQLLDGIASAPKERTVQEQARYLLAHLVDWHRREERVAWGEYHRLRVESAEDLLDEPAALVGLQFVTRVFTPPAGGRAKKVVDRYRFPPQENELRSGHQLRLPNDDEFGEIDALDRLARTVDVKKAIAQTDHHPPVVIGIRIIGAPKQEESIQRVAAAVVADGFDDLRGSGAVNDLLLRRPPRLLSMGVVQLHPTDVPDRAVHDISDLDASVLPIQGPPGAGKTFTGARMIASLVAAGRKVGVVANGHKVIRKLLVDAGRAAGGSIALAHKPGEDPIAPVPDVPVEEPETNEQALTWVRRDGARVLGGTAWMWARPEFAGAVDVLFVDEAGQMSLANVLAVAPAGRNLVLLGDPQQLEQPQKGFHPDGVDVSALDHVLAGEKTMPPDRGLFLPVTWRLSPAICAFTSEVFYEGKLESRAGLERQVLVGAGPFDGAGLVVVPVDHDGNRNASDEEAGVVADIVSMMLAGGAAWVDADGVTRRLTPADILVVAPYNAHVARIAEGLAGRAATADVRVGTVDKFQGQEAPVVIYSMATSRPEDAPRGLEFLYSLNRLNVATSRARCVSILVCSPNLFEPECQTPRQMQLANALARLRELARRVPIARP